MNIVKRDGTIKKFNIERIYLSIKKAYEEVYGNDIIYLEEIDKVINKIKKEKIDNNDSLEIEDLQDCIVENLSSINKKVAKAYTAYREKRTKIRESKNPLLKSVEGILNFTNKEVLEENSNKQSMLNSTQRDLMAGEVSKAIARQIIPKHLLDAHDNGEIKIHDMDYFANPMHNCELIDLKDMFTNGTVINKKMIETPKSLRTAMTVATQVLAQVASSQYGGQTISLSHIAPYVRVSKKKLTKRFKEYGIKGDLLNKIVEKELELEIKDSVQTFNYQVNTLQTTNG